MVGDIKYAKVSNALMLKLGLMGDESSKLLSIEG